MASRLAVQHHNRDEVVPGGKKQQKDEVGEQRNRRALGDIGNLATLRANAGDGKPPPQVCRPITRSFCAQLLANAQAAAENKKTVAVKVDVGVVAGAAGRGAARKPATKNPTVKPKPEEVIEISPDTIEEKPGKEEKPVEAKKNDEGLLKKKKQTFTAVLSARSKAACGLTDRPNPQIIDIDAGDLTNELTVVEYVEDIYKFYKETENESRVHDYMGSQPEINEKMRSILIDWLVEVHHKFELMPETLYLTINIIDRYLAVKTVPRKELQLLGISSMLTASKYEEIWAPEVNDFVRISDRAYTHQQVLVMEKCILAQLEWNLTVPTHYVFLVRFIKAAVADSQLESMAYFLAELGVMNYDLTIRYCSSMLAASAVYVARCTLNRTPFWNDTLKLHTGFSELQLMDCAKLLASFHSMAADHKLKVIHRKYSNAERGAVALLPPAKALLVASPAAGAQI